MKNLVLFFGVMIFLTGFIPADAKDFYITKAEITAEVREDGTVRITESRIFDFDGSFSWVKQHLDLQGFGELRDIHLSTEGREFRQDDSETPGTYSLSRSGDTLIFKWNFEAENEQKAFTISYTLTEAIPKDGDWAQFLWTFIGDEWDVSTNDITISVLFPDAAGTGQVYAWSRNQLPGEQLEIRDREVHFTADLLRSGRLLELRTVFPSYWVSGTVEADAPINPGAFQREHEIWQAEEERKAAFRESVRPYADLALLLITLISLFTTVFLVSKYGRNAKPSAQIPDEIDHPPSQHKPALIGWLMTNNTVSTSHLIATILDLSRRGYFKIQPDKDDEKDKNYAIIATDKSDADLTGWELDLYSYLSEKIGEGKSSFKKLFADDDDHTWISKWNAAVSAEAKSQGWLLYQPRVAVLQFTVQGFLLVFCFLIVNYATTTNYGFGPLIAVIIGFFSCFSFWPRTETGQTLFKQWRAYRNALRNKTVTDKPEWKGLHIIYAVCFGLSDKALSELTQNMNLKEDDMTWILMVYGTTFNPAAFSGMVSSINVSASAAISASTGASVGSAGGGGGGSAG